MLHNLAHRVRHVFGRVYPQCKDLPIHWVFNPSGPQDCIASVVYQSPDCRESCLTLSTVTHLFKFLANEDWTFMERLQDSLTVAKQAYHRRRRNEYHVDNALINVNTAINDFCLQPSDLEDLLNIKIAMANIPTHTLLLWSDVESKALKVWGSHEVLGRVRTIREEAQRKILENSRLTEDERSLEKVLAGLNKREDLSKCSEDTVVTPDRAIDEFCLQPKDLEELEEIKIRIKNNPEYSLFWRSEVQDKALSVWGSHDVLAKVQMIKSRPQRVQHRGIYFL